jgi:hypothetical protein
MWRGARFVALRLPRPVETALGAEAFVAVVKPNQERGREDYRLDEVEAPARHPTAVRRLTGRRRSTVDYSGGELQGRRVDPRR